MSHEHSSLTDEPKNLGANEDQPGASRPKSRRTTRRKILLWGGSTLAVGLGTAAGAFALGRRVFGESAPPMRDHRVKRPKSAPRMVIARGKKYQVVDYEKYLMNLT